MVCFDARHGQLGVLDTNATPRPGRIAGPRSCGNGNPGERVKHTRSGRSPFSPNQGQKSTQGPAGPCVR